MTVVLPTILSARQWIQAERASGHTIGLVPTMGFLHEGHLSLIRRARERCDRVTVSLFVNPIQFGPGEDYERYPKSFDRDFALLERENVDAVFYPDAKEMYPGEPVTVVSVEKLGDGLCGASRPGHFRGVTTVVAKLFNILQPDIAFFGQKDVQQSVIVQRMVEDLNFPVEIEVRPTVREPDGLAMSSRNIYLSPAERAQATILYRSLQQAQDMVQSGTRDASLLKKKMQEMIGAVPEGRLDYVSVVDPCSLEEVRQIDHDVLVALAVRFGKTRLIDNIIIAPKKQGETEPGCYAR